MPYFDGRAGRVYYRHWASAQPRAGLVFLHGFGEHSGLYHRYGAALNARDIDLWALDEVGHGLSDGARGRFVSYDDLAANGGLLAGIAEDTVPGLPLVISGHSLGSLAAVILALDDPRRFQGVVVSGAALSPLPWLQDAADNHEQGSIALDPATLSSDPFYLDQLENDPLAFTALDADADGAAGAEAGPDARTIFGPAWERLEKELPGLNLPVLAAHGAKDPVTPLEGVLAWRDRLPGLRVAEFADAGHDVLNERAHQEVARTVADFILGLQAVRASEAAGSGH